MNGKWSELMQCFLAPSRSPKALCKAACTHQWAAAAPEQFHDLEAQFLLQAPFYERYSFYPLVACKAAKVRPTTFRKTSKEDDPTQRG